MKIPFTFRILLFLVLLAPLPVFAQLDIQFDYSLDTSGFFSGTAGTIRRNELTAAAAVFENRMTQETMPGITPSGPSGPNTWTEQFLNPSTGATSSISNPTVAANSFTIYVGARSLGGSELGLASGAGYAAAGTQAWLDSFSARNTTTTFNPFGGSISFDISAAWYFDSDPSTTETFAGLYDFYSVAQHEIGHILGFSSGSQAFAANTSGTNFVGAAAAALYGGPVPLASGLSHWAENVVSGNQEATMTPSITSGQRKNFTALDFAALKDIGYTLTVPEPSTTCLAGIGVVAVALSLRRRRFS